MTTTADLGIGLIGAGHVAYDAHAPAIARAAGVRLVGVFDVSAESAGRLAKRYDVSRVYGALEELLRDAAVEAVIIALPNRLHREVVERCAAAGLAILCEKPLAHNIEDARAIVEAVERARVVCQVGFNHRYWAQNRLIKDLVAAGFFGTIHSFRSVFSAKWDNMVDASNYRYDLEQSGGATMMDLTVHRIDLIRYLLGQEFASVTASLRHSAIPPRVDDNVHLLGTLSGGATGTLASDRFSPALADSTEIYGTLGSAHWATEGLTPFTSTPLAIYTTHALADLPASLAAHHYPQTKAKVQSGGWDGWLTVRPTRSDCYAEQLIGFAARVRGQPTCVVSADAVDGLRANEVVQAAYVSAIERRWADVPVACDRPFVIPKFS